MKSKTYDLLNELETQNYEMLNAVNELKGEGTNKIILAFNPITKPHWIIQLFKRYQQNNKTPKQ